MRTLILSLLFSVIFIQASYANILGAKPGAPDNVVATLDEQNHAVTLDWTDLALNETSFVVYANYQEQPLLFVDANIETATVKIDPGQSASYIVCAVNATGKGCSEPSPKASVKFSFKSELISGHVVDGDLKPIPKAKVEFVKKMSTIIVKKFPLPAANAISMRFEVPDHFESDSYVTAALEPEVTWNSCFAAAGHTVILRNGKNLLYTEDAYGIWDLSMPLTGYSHICEGRPSKLTLSIHQPGNVKSVEVLATADDKGFYSVPLQISGTYEVRSYYEPSKKCEFIKTGTEFMSFTDTTEKVLVICR